jgi:5-formyltetrahydrofolate cyclo-ligase
MTISEEKSALRKAMIKQRMAIDTSVKASYDSWICSQLEKTIIQRACKTVHAYIPIANEIDITTLLQKLLDLSIVVVCPKTRPARKLENRVLHSLEELEIGIMGTKHPKAPDLYEGNIDLAIVPGLAFDAAKYRLGYGGAYYDTFLAAMPDTFKLGIFYPFQQVDTIPVEAHDVRLDEVLYKAF